MLAAQCVFQFDCRSPRSCVLWLLVMLWFIPAGIVGAGEPPQSPAPTLADVLRPFVDDHTVAGAVVLVASPEKILCTDKGLIGHAGSYNTHSNFDPGRGLITVFLVQQSAWRNPQGRGLPELVRQAAERRFAPTSPRDDAAILLPGDPPSVRQARRDLLVDIRRRYGVYSGAEMGGLVDMFLRNDPELDRKANQQVLAIASNQQRTRENQLSAKGKAWDGQLYPEEQQLVEVYFRYGSRLTPESKQAIETLWQQSLFTDREARHRGPQWRADGCWYWKQADTSIGANWGLIAADACILGGQIAGRRDFVTHGRQALERWFTYASQSGMISQECNLMEGHWRIYSFVLVQIAEWADDPDTRRLARLLLERVWLEKLVYFHQPTLRECGATGRCVVTRHGEPIVDTNQRLWLATQLREPPAYPPPPATIDPALRMAVRKQEEPYLVSSWRLPDYLQELALSKQLPQVVQSTCEFEVPPLGGTYPPNRPPLYPNPLRDRWPSDHLYTYLTPSFALGTMSRGWVDVGMPLLAFWKAHDGRPLSAGDHRALYFRYQHDDRKPFGRATAILRGRQVELPLDQGWAEYGRHAAMQDHGRAIVIYRPRLDYLRGFDAVPGLPGYVTLDGDLSVASLQALACFYREDASPRGFSIDREPVRDLPAVVGRGQWVFVDDGPTWIAVRPLTPTDLGGSRPARLVRGDRHVFLEVDNWRPAQPGHPDLDRLMHCRSGFLTAVGDRTDYADFEHFRQAILDSRVEERCEGNADRVQWTAGKQTMCLNWDVYEDRYLERSVDGATQDPWPRFSCAEYAQGLCVVRRGRAVATTSPSPKTPVWLLALDRTETYVVYQPDPGKAVPLVLDCPLGRVSAPSFPLGKLVFRRASPEKGDAVQLEIDAQYPAQPAYVTELEIRNVRGPLRATINGRPAAGHRDDHGVWHVAPEAPAEH
jgi:hypothetical protein